MSQSPCGKVEHQGKPDMCYGCVEESYSIRDAEIARLRAEVEIIRQRTLDWAAKHYGCDKIGPDCPGKCIVRCEDIANLRVTIADTKDRLDKAEAVVRATEEYFSADYALAHCGNGPECEERDKQLLYKARMAFAAALADYRERI